MLTRGDFLQAGERSDARRPGISQSASRESAPPNRLTFAKWLVDRQSPTTARALVNRDVAGLFRHRASSAPPRISARKRGALASRNCSTGSPSNSWIAGWSMKAMHRLIVTSATYRQSSQRHARAASRRSRTTACSPAARASASKPKSCATSRSAASGLLTRTVGGPSVFPPAPAFLFLPPASYGPKTWKDETGPDRYRRALYTFRFRSVPYPVLQTFDAPNGDFSCVRRVALQHAAAGARDSERAALRRSRAGAWRCGR